MGNPGQIDAMFERILVDYKHYEPTVHSRPPDGPWVVTLDKFVTYEECDRLIDLGAARGYERSKVCVLCVVFCDDNVGVSHMCATL